MRGAGKIKDARILCASSSATNFNASSVYTNFNVCYVVAVVNYALSLTKSPPFVQKSPENFNSLLAHQIYIQ